MWRYPATVNLMKMAGWEEDGDCVGLRDDSDAEAISKFLEQELQIVQEPTSKRPGNVNTSASSSSKCCALTNDTAGKIISAIETSYGPHLKEVLSPYHPTCVKHMQVSEFMSIIACVYLMRRIGIARILATEYEIDFNGSNELGLPDFFAF